MSRRGFIYVMRSPAVNWTKIGLSERAPHFRAKELSTDKVYGGIGPWEVADYCEVEDMFSSEKALHRHFSAKNVSHLTARELFDVPLEVACSKLLEVAQANLVRGDLVGRMKLEPELVDYLLALFKVTGIFHFKDMQEAWTLSLFPGTAGGRWFTINIDRHEVAFAAPIPGTNKSHFMLYLDSKAVKSLSFTLWKWRAGAWSLPWLYASAGPRSVRISWTSNWGEAKKVLEMVSVRRALLAYWYDALLRLRDRGKRSLFAKNHNHNAVQELLRLSQRQRNA